MRAVVERRQACALQKGARRIARCGGGYPAFAGVPLPSFYFVARVERSETRERRWSRTFVPGFRCAQSGLRNGETGITENRKPGPTPALRWTEPVSRFTWQGFATLGRRGAPRERSHLSATALAGEGDHPEGVVEGARDST